MEITLEKLLNKGLNNNLTDEDLITLEEIFTEVFGYLPLNMALDPRNVLERIRTKEARDDEAVEAWYATDNELDDSTHKPDLDFMCKEPNDCYSYKLYGEACKCVRQQFSTPSAYRDWRSETLLDMGNKLRGIDTQEK